MVAPVVVGVGQPVSDHQMTCNLSYLRAFQLHFLHAANSSMHVNNTNNNYLTFNEPWVVMVPWFGDVEIGAYVGVTFQIARDLCVIV
jgi:hypothetical protein